MYLNSLNKPTRRPFSLHPKPSFIQNLLRLCRGDKPRYKLRRKDNKIVFLSSKGMSNSFLLEYNSDGVLSLNSINPRKRIVDVLHTNAYNISLNVLPDSPYKLSSASKFEISPSTPATLCIIDLHGNSDYYHWQPCPGRNRRKLVDLSDPTFTLATYTPHTVLSYVLGLGHVVFNLKLTPRLALAFLYLLGQVLISEYEESQLNSAKSFYQKYVILSQSPCQTISKAPETVKLTNSKRRIKSSQWFESGEITLVC